MDINFLNLPTVCPSCGDPVEWNENEIELVCVNPDCEAQALQRMVAFFEILGVDKMGEGVCTQLYNAGYNTINKVLKMSKQDMENIEGFGKRKSDTLFTNIHKSITNVPLSKVQHASGCFRTLGSRKLALVEHFGLNTPKMDEILAISGFAIKSAREYVYGLEKFKRFIEGLGITFTSTEKVKVEGNKCQGMTFVFTGIRDKAAEVIIAKNGGNVGSSVSTKTTHLIMKAKGSGSSKEQKAIDLGVTIWTINELKSFLNMV